MKNNKCKTRIKTLTEKNKFYLVSYFLQMPLIRKIVSEWKNTKLALIYSFYLFYFIILNRNLFQFISVNNSKEAA